MKIKLVDDNGNVIDQFGGTNRDLLEVWVDLVRKQEEENQ